MIANAETATAPTIWADCYEDRWTGFIIPEAFAHPAKYSKALIERICDHCLARGWLRKGDRVGDCFGGVATGGLIAAYRGLEWVGVELEPRFVGWGRQNITLHKSKLLHLACPLPRIVQGDSRRFHEIIAETCAIVTSPPYSETLHHGGGPETPRDKLRGGGSLAGLKDGYPESPGQIGRLKEGEVDAVISSPPFAAQQTGGGIVHQADRRTVGRQNCGYQNHGKTNGQIADLREGDVSAVITSPPYSDISTGAGGLNTKAATKPWQQAGRSAKAASQDTDQKYGQTEGQISRLNGGSVEAVVTSPPFRDARSDTTKAGATKGGGPCADRLHSVQAGTQYGTSDGQIDSLTTGDVHAVVTSPPWEKNSEGSRKGSKFKDPAAALKCNRGNGASDAAVLAQAARDEQKVYGESPGQIGKDSGETYWAAMKAVYASCFLAIKPGGIIAVVVKNYVKDKKVVPLCDDTARLLEHCGFLVIERVHAMLVKETSHGDLFTGSTTSKTSRKSFFRRLAEAKGSPEINFEEVIFCRRP